MPLSEDKIHEGHRSRMREKLLSHGDRIFLTYELLEMFLYGAVPYKDTNPIAQMLLRRFGGLKGVFRAEKHELCEIAGVGERVADAIIALGKFASCNESEITELPPLSGYAERGRYFTELFKDKTDKEVALLLFNNRMEPIFSGVLYTADFASAEVKPERFVKEAVGKNASACVIAHSHPFGAPYPTMGDLQTNKAVEMGLNKAGITLVEHYVVAGRSFSGMMHHLDTSFFQPKSEEEEQNEK